MSRRPTVNRNVPMSAATAILPPIQTQVPVAKHKPIRFQPGMFGAGISVVLAETNFDGTSLDFGDVELAWDKVRAGHQLVRMTRRTYERVATSAALDQEVQHIIQAGIPMGVKSTVRDVRASSAWAANPVPVVDRSGEPDLTPIRDLMSYSSRVASLVTEMMGFDPRQMSDQTRVDFARRYGVLRDEFREYHEIIAQIEGAFEVLQGMVKEML